MKIEVTKGYHSDAESIARMVYSAGPEIYEYIYSVNGKTALSFLIYEYRKGTGMTGYKNLTLAVDGSKVVGTGTFYNSVDLVRMSAQTISSIFRFYGFRPGLKVLSRIRHISSIIRQPGPNEMHIANLGVK